MVDAWNGDNTSVEYNLAMLLAFLGVIRYGAALFAVKEYMHIL